jgi:ribosome-binding factor A
MKERVERLAMEIREILGEMVTRQEIKDPRVQDAGLITITHVRLTGDLREATALFTVHGADPVALKKVREGLNRAGGFFRHRLGKELSVRAVPTVHFEIDQVFETEAKVDSVLREIAAQRAVADAGSEAPDPDGGDPGDAGEANAAGGQGKPQE